MMMMGACHPRVLRDLIHPTRAQASRARLGGSQCKDAGGSLLLGLCQHWLRPHYFLESLMPLPRVPCCALRGGLILLCGGLIRI